MEQLLDFVGNHPYLSSGTVITGALLLFTEIRARKQKGIGLAPQHAVRLINSGAVVVDVRSLEQFATGHIVNARNVPFADLSSAPESVHKSKEKPILVYCDKGVSGSRAAGLLRAAGYQNAFNLKGGLAAWRQENMPTVTATASKKNKNKNKNKNG